MTDDLTGADVWQAIEEVLGEGMHARLYHETAFPPSDVDEPGEYVLTWSGGELRAPTRRALVEQLRTYQPRRSALEQLPHAALRAGEDVRSRLAEHGLDVVALAVVVVVRAPAGAPMPYYVGDSYPDGLEGMDRRALALGLAQSSQNVVQGTPSAATVAEAEERARGNEG